MHRNAKMLLAVVFTAALLAGGLLATYWPQPAVPGAGALGGKVQGGGSPIAGSQVTLYAAGDGKPTELASAKTGDDGTFKLDPGADKLKDSAGKVLYLVARGGTPKAGGGNDANDAIALLAVLGTELPNAVTVNEFTTVASVWTGAQFLEGDVFSGNKLGLRIAAGNVPHFVDLATGGYGGTIQNSLNGGQTPTMANFATLANVLAAAVTQIKPDATRQFLAAATPRSGKVPTDTLTALQGVARESGHKAERLFKLLGEFYPVPKGKNLRPVPFMPYLSWAPSAWVLPLKFDGGGLSAPGKMMFDSQGNLWAGNNFIVGFQNQDALWAGNLSKFAPNGRPLSPMTTGFTGGGLEGIGFGMAVDADDNVWACCYGSKTIVKFDKTGKPLSPPEGYNFGGQLGLMQGIIVTPSGDVWACDVEKSQMVYMPKGDPSKGKLLFQNKTGNPKENPGKLSAPFHLAIDQQDRIWVSNFVSDWVTRFPVSDPTKVETFKTGFSPGGMGIDSKGNVWIASHFGNSKRGPAIFAKVIEVMKKGGNYDPVLVRAMVETRAGPEGGNVTILRSDGSEAPGSPVFGGGVVVPWAIAVDGNDHVWVSNFSSASTGIVELCGCRPEANPAGMKMGDQISPPGGYVGGGMQMLIDIDIDPAGNVWVSNNWNNYEAALGRVAEALQTQGAGQGVVVFYGMARPVRTPLIGPVRPSK
jgi:streptogramin lyase